MNHAFSCTHTTQRLLLDLRTGFWKSFYGEENMLFSSTGNYVSTSLRMGLRCLLDRAVDTRLAMENEILRLCLAHS